MDELQHWLADARYSQSLMEGSHQPMKQLPLPLRVWEGKAKFCNDLDWDPETILSQPLGRYFVGRYVKEVFPTQLWLHTFYCTCYDLETKEETDLKEALNTLHELLIDNKQDSVYPALYKVLQHEMVMLDEIDISRQPSTTTERSSTQRLETTSEEPSSSTTTPPESPTGRQPKRVLRRKHSIKELFHYQANQVQQQREHVLQAIDPLRIAINHRYKASTTSLLALFLQTGVQVTPPSSYLATYFTTTNESEFSESHMSSSTTAYSAEEKSSTPRSSDTNAAPERRTSTYKTKRERRSILMVVEDDAEMRKSVYRRPGNSGDIATLMDLQKGRKGRYVVAEPLPVDKRSEGGNDTTIPWLDKYVETLWWSQRPMQRDDMAEFRNIGRGAFGIVSGVTCVYTGKMFALKAMNRKQIKFKKATSLVKHEYEILRVLVEKPSPFVVCMQYSFADYDNIYFCLNLLTGGDLRFALSRCGSFNARVVRLFIGQIALGMSHLHSLGILYRDLKPENIMLDKQGKCVITDLGLAVRFTKDKLYCRGRTGTSGYWAPEVISKEKYSYEADWWSLGVMLFELLLGMGPFSRRRTGMETRDEGTKHYDINYEEISILQCQNPANGIIDLLKSLLDRNQTTRMNSLEKLMESKFYSGFNWYKVRTNTHTPLYVPDSDGAINAEGAQSILDGAASKLEACKNVELSELDDFENMWCVASLRHQEDIVEVLEMERVGELDHLEPVSNGCCKVQ